MLFKREASGCRWVRRERCSSEVPVRRSSQMRKGVIRWARRKGGKCQRVRYSCMFESGKKKEGGSRTWRSVNEQIVQLPPPDVPQKLLDHAFLLRSSPNDTVLTTLQQKRHAHHCQPLRCPISVDWNPAVGGLMDCLPVEPQHARDGGSCEVRVENSDAESKSVEGEG